MPNYNEADVFMLESFSLPNGASRSSLYIPPAYLRKKRTFDRNNVRIVAEKEK
jgi:hypothetical protein